MRAPIRWPTSASLTATAIAAGGLGLLVLAAGCRSETRTTITTPPPAPPPPKLAVFDANGTPLQDGSILEAIVTELPGDHMTIKGELKMTNTGGPVSGPVRSGWRLPGGFVPWQKTAPINLPVGNEFAYEIGYTNVESIAAAPVDEKRKVAFLCELEPGLWLPAEIPVEFYLRREQDAEDLLHVHLRLRPQWPLSFQPEGFSAGPTAVRRTLTEGRGEDAADVDWVHAYKFVYRGHSLLGHLTGYRYLKARGPFDEPAPARPLVVTELLPPPAHWPPPSPPAGFQVALPWNLGKYVLQGNETSRDWSASFHLGRGGYVTPGRHDIAVELHSRGVTVHRSFYTIEVLEERPFPSIELIGEDGRPLVPGSQLLARVDPGAKTESPPASDSSRAVTLTVPVRVIADGLPPEDQLPNLPHDLYWMFLVNDALRPHPQAAGEADIFEVRNARYYVLLDSGKLAVLGDGKPHDLELQFPLDPKLAQARAGRPGLWVPSGVHQVRLLAFSASRGPVVARRILEGVKPERSLFLFERDFEIRISQSTPIDSDP